MEPVSVRMEPRSILIEFFSALLHQFICKNRQTTCSCFRLMSVAFLREHVVHKGHV
jgi:hypothetical protein